MTEKQVQFAQGRLSLVSFLDRTMPHEYVPAPSDALDFTWNGQPVAQYGAPWVEVPAVDFTYMNGAPMDESRYHPTTLPLAGLARTFEGTGNRPYSPIQVYQNRETHAGVFVGDAGVGGGRVLDQSRPEVIDWERKLLESKQRAWGDFHRYHPRVTGDSADWYLQRISGDRRRGIVVPGHALKRSITIYPKGLLPRETYHVSYQESAATESHLGADLMMRGITVSSMPDGEIIYLNLPFHPGNTVDRVPPQAPSDVRQEVATHMGYSGGELRWKPGKDDHWVSYYQIYRNRVPIEKIAKGTYYFDHSLNADMAAHYAVATVAGSGNRSAPTSAAGGTSRLLALIVDDTSRMLTYSGAGWTH